MELKIWNKNSQMNNWLFITLASWYFSASYLESFECCSFISISKRVLLTISLSRMRLFIFVFIVLPVLFVFVVIVSSKEFAFSTTKLQNVPLRWLRCHSYDGFYSIKMHIIFFFHSRFNFLAIRELLCWYVKIFN